MLGEGSVDSPFHAGEQAVQERLGVREGIEPWARKVIRSYLPAEHRAFYTALPYLVAAARDGAGRPWATIVAGTPGFIGSPDPETLVIKGGLSSAMGYTGCSRPGWMWVYSESNSQRDVETA